MRFGRVTGYVVAYDNVLELTVSLDRGNSVEAVRTERVPRLGDDLQKADLGWQADQYTQETIGNELAMLGWEAIAEEPAAEAPPGSGVSAAYVVRNLGAAG